MGKTLGLLERIRQDDELSELWDRLGDGMRQELTDIDNGKKVPNLLGDTMFKGIFDPDANPERLSRFVSSILGRNVRVLHSLNTEGYRFAERSKGVILDLLVQFEDGSIGNVEIQRRGIGFPPKRAAVYSSNMVTRQFTARHGQDKKEVDYDSVQPVYTIIIMEQSSGEFRVSDEYIHHFRQTSDTGVRLELLQYYDYVCLDRFHEKKPHIAGELEQWLAFLSIREVDEMVGFLAENKSFQSVYECAILMLSDREELVRMMSDLFAYEDPIASLNKTNESMIKRLTRENERQAVQLREQSAQLGEQSAQLEHQSIQLKDQSAQLEHQSIQLKDQSAQLEHQSIQLKDQSAQLEKKDEEIAKLKTMLKSKGQ